MDQKWLSLETYEPYIVNLAIAIFVIVIGWTVSKWVRRIILKIFRYRKLDETLSRFIASLAKNTLLAATFIMALATVGIQTTSLLAVFASAGLAIGLALQGGLANFASGVLILLFRPFVITDKIGAAGVTGVVDDITIFTTTLITLDNRKIIVPNSSITSGNIINFSAKGLLRGTVKVGLNYGVDIDKALDVLVKAAKRADLVETKPAPAAALAGLTAGAVEFELHSWSEDEDHLGMLHNVRKAVYEDLNKAGIEVAVDQIVVNNQIAA